MAAANSVTAPERTLVSTRIFDAPRELVYRAWTDPAQLAKWFPPEGFGTARCEVDARPGGVFRLDMKAPDGPPFDGKVFPGPGTFREVVPNERLVFTMTPEMGDGRTMPTVLMTVRFEDLAGKTRLTVEQTLPTVEEFVTMAKTGMAEGIRQSLDKLAGVLSGDPSDRSNRGASVTDRTLTLDGTYREVVTPERVVQVLGDGRVMTMALDEVLGGTRLTLSIEMAMSEEQERAGYTQILRHLAQHLATFTKTR